MAETITYSELVSIIVKELNKFREDPMCMLPILQKRMENYQGNIYLYNKSISIETEEGVGPVKQLVSILNGVNRLPKLNWSFQLHCVANKRAKMLARSQVSIGPENSESMISLKQLLTSQIQYSSEVSQHFLYGYCDPLDITMELLIDDGNPQRQNRMQLLNPLNNFIGIGIEQHPKFKFVVVIIFASSVEPKKVPNFSQISQNFIQVQASKDKLNHQINPDHYNKGIVSFEDFQDRKEPNCKSCNIF